MVTSKQRFRNMWIWLILIILDAVTAYAFISQLIYKIPFGDHPAPNSILIIASTVVFGITILVKVMYLKVTISKTSIELEYYPFLKRSFLISDIDVISRTKYSPIRDYGGWGIRYGVKGIAYNIDGNIGLQLKMKNGINILIGIDKYTSLHPLKLENYENNETKSI